MSKVYKCPWCQYKFEEKDLKTSPNNPYIYNCPNPSILAGSGLPVCQKVLPPNYLSATSITIALAGDLNSGKSNYQMALLYELQMNKALFKLGISGWPVGDPETLKRIEGKFKQMHEGTPLNRTTEVEDPFLIQLEVRNGVKFKTVYFSFYDNPGGWFNDPEVIIREMPNVINADGLIFLIDPIEIEHLWEYLIVENPYLRNIMPRGLRRPINAVTQVLRQVKSVSKQNDLGGDINIQKIYLDKLAKWVERFKEIEVPVAFTISKFNQLRNVITEIIPYDSTDMEIMCIDSISGKYDDRVQKEISKSIELLLFPEDGTNLYLKDMIKQYYKHADFFACNAVGVDKNGIPVELEPQGVLLPLIWLLDKMQIYK